MAMQRRSLNEIESDLDHNRERMGSALDALGQRLSGDRLFERGVGYLRSTGAEEFLDNLRGSVARNPLPLTVCGVGLAWLMVSGSDRASQAVSDYTPDNAGERIGAAAANASDSTRSAGRSTRSAGRSAREGADRALGSGRRTMQQLSGGARRGAARAGATARGGSARVVDGVNYMQREQPILSGLFGLAIGAAIAASLPRSASEDKALGSTRDEFMHSARETGAEKAEQAGAVAESAAHAASDAARSEADRQRRNASSD